MDKCSLYVPKIPWYKICDACSSSIYPQIVKVFVRLDLVSVPSTGSSGTKEVTECFLIRVFVPYGSKDSEKEKHYCSLAGCCYQQYFCDKGCQCGYFRGLFCILHYFYDVVDTGNVRHSSFYCRRIFTPSLRGIQIHAVIDPMLYTMDDLRPGGNEAPSNRMRWAPDNPYCEMAKLFCAPLSFVIGMLLCPKRSSFTRRASEENIQIRTHDSIPIAVVFLCEYFVFKPVFLCNLKPFGLQFLSSQKIVIAKEMNLEWSGCCFSHHVGLRLVLDTLA